MSAGFGYFVDGKFSFLSMENEYFFDSPSNTLYIWSE